MVHRPGTSSCLVSISHFSKPFNYFRISFIPKDFPTGAGLNHFYSSLSTKTSISLRINSSDLLLLLEKFNKEGIFICSSFWSKNNFVSGYYTQIFLTQHNHKIKCRYFHSHTHSRGISTSK